MLPSGRELPQFSTTKLDDVRTAAEFLRDELKGLLLKRGIREPVEALLQYEPDFHKYKIRLYQDYIGRLLSGGDGQSHEEDMVGPPSSANPDQDSWEGPSFMEACEESWIQECALRKYVLRRDVNKEIPAILFGTNQYRERARLLQEERKRLEAEDALERARGTPSCSPTVFFPAELWDKEDIPLLPEQAPRKKPVNRTQEWLKTLEAPHVETLPQLSPISSEEQAALCKSPTRPGDRTRGSRISKTKTKTENSTRRDRTTSLLESELESGLSDIAVPSIEVASIEVPGIDDLPQLSPDSSKDLAKNRKTSTRNRTQGSRITKTKSKTKKSTGRIEQMLLRETQFVGRDHTGPVTRSRQRKLLS